jgi:hypothetical protein
MDKIFKRPFLWPELYRGPGRVVNSLYRATINCTDRDFLSTETEREI